MAGSAAAATMVLGTPARAESCADVRADARIAPPWSDAVQELRRQIAQLPRSDCEPMTLTIEPAGDGLRIVAVATDGRRAERQVHHPESLVATGLGLVMAIPAVEGAAGGVSASAPASAPASPPAPAPGSTPTTGAPSRTLGLWFGADVGGRIAQPTSIAMIDVGLHGTLTLDARNAWILTLALRNTPLGLVSSQGLDRDAFRQVSVGVGLGRRFVAGDVAFDVVLEPSIVAMLMEYDFANDTDTHGDDVELGVDALARMDIALGRSWALTFTLEGDVLPGNLGSSPARLDAPAGQPEPPPFPAWQSALRVGVMGELL